MSRFVWWGGANVLERGGDTIGKDNVESVVGLLKDKNMDVKAVLLGGIKRRSISLDIEQGSVYCTEGDGSESLLWQSK